MDVGGGRSAGLPLGLGPRKAELGLELSDVLSDYHANKIHVISYYIKY